MLLLKKFRNALLHSSPEFRALPFSCNFAERNLERASRLRYGPEDANMKAAIQAVHGKILSIRQASKRYNIPRSTLQRRTAGKYVFARLHTQLTAEEEKEIAAWAIDILKRGFLLSQSEMKDSVQMLLNKKDRETNLNNHRPGQKWLRAFLNRHPMVDKMMTNNRHKIHASITESTIRNWFSKVCTPSIRYYFVITVTN